MKTFEVRSLAKDIEAPKGNTLTGYAVVWDEITQEIPDFLERFERKAFADCLADSPDVVALFNHDDDHLLGRTLSGTLRLSEDDVGLRVEVDLPDTALGKEIVELVSRGDLRGMSIRFIALDETFEQTEEGLLRTITKADLFDVSVVTTPAYRGTSVSLRSGVSLAEDASRILAAQARRRAAAKIKIREA